MLSGAGGTNLMSAIARGLAILKNRTQKNAITAMFVLTDGKDDKHEVDAVRLAATANEVCKVSRHLLNVSNRSAAQCIRSGLGVTTMRETSTQSPVAPLERSAM